MILIAGPVFSSEPSYINILLYILLIPSTILVLKKCIDADLPLFLRVVGFIFTLIISLIIGAVVSVM